MIDCPISHRPAVLLETQLEKSMNEIKKYIEQDEDVLSYALFPDVAIDFFNYRIAKKNNVDTSLVGESDGFIFYPV